MGCDIHIYTEKNLDGEGWTSADFYAKRKYADGEIVMEIVDVYDGRNYDLFALLANVRNRGYIKPICEPRGFPEDCCAEIKEEFEVWEYDGHNASWFTLKELMAAFEQNKELMASGLITLEQAEELDRGIKPTSWCQGTNRENVVHRVWPLENGGLEEIIKNTTERLRHFCYSWKENTDKIRIVFWFDN